MASFKEKVASVADEQAVKYARQDFKRNAPRILNLVEKFDVKIGSIHWLPMNFVSY